MPIPGIDPEARPARHLRLLVKDQIHQDQAVLPVERRRARGPHPAGPGGLVTEAERVRRFGFTQSELDRQKDQVLRGFEKAYNERDKTESAVWAGKYVATFL